MRCLLQPVDVRTPVSGVVMGKVTLAQAQHCISVRIRLDAVRLERPSRVIKGRVDDSLGARKVLPRDLVGLELWVLCHHDVAPQYCKR